MRFKREEKSWLYLIKRSAGKDDPEIAAEISRDEAFNKKIKKIKEKKALQEERKKLSIKTKIKMGIAKIRGK